MKCDTCTRVVPDISGSKLTLLGLAQYSIYLMISGAIYTVWRYNGQIFVKTCAVS